MITQCGAPTWKVTYPCPTSTTESLLFDEVSMFQMHFKRLKIELPFDPEILLLGKYPKNPETPIQKNLCTPMFIAAQLTIAKIWKQPKCP